MTTFTAQTAYGVTIPKALADRKAALAWADEHGDRFPGCRVVMSTANGARTIWKHQPQEMAA